MHEKNVFNRRKNNPKARRTKELAISGQNGKTNKTETDQKICIILSIDIIVAAVAIAVAVAVEPTTAFPLCAVYWLAREQCQRNNKEQ